MLETPEVKLVNEKRSRELISVYKKKMGLSVDTKTRAECEKVNLFAAFCLLNTVCHNHAVIVHIL